MTDLQSVGNEELEERIDQLETLLADVQGDVDANTEAVDSLPDDIEERELLSVPEVEHIETWEGESIGTYNGSDSEYNSTEIGRVMSGVHVDLSADTYIDARLTIRFADGSTTTRRWEDNASLSESEDVSFRMAEVEELDMDALGTHHTAGDYEFEVEGFFFT